MTRLFRTITALLLAVIFLVSFTGIRLMVHHCAGCGTSEIVFEMESPSCCSMLLAENAQSAHDDMEHKAPSEGLDASFEAITCCVAIESDHCDSSCGQSCCSLETIYLKGEYDVTLSKAVATLLVPVMDIQADIAGQASHAALQQDNLPCTSFDDPPHKRTGRAFVLFAHQIKIPA